MACVPCRLWSILHTATTKTFKKAKELMLPLTLARSCAMGQGLAKTPARSQMGPVPNDRGVLLPERSTPTALCLSVVTTAEWP